MSDVQVMQEQMYLIRKGGYYYRPNAQGYTTCKAEAGRYTLEKAISYSHPNGADGPRNGITYEPAPATRPAPVGEPVAWMYREPRGPGAWKLHFKVSMLGDLPDGWTETPLYTRPALDVDGLVEALRECAEDLEVEVRSRFIDRDTGLPHPANQRRYDRDMVPVRKARACLAAIKDATDAGYTITKEPTP